MSQRDWQDEVLIKVSKKLGHFNVYNALAVHLFCEWGDKNEEM